MKENEFEKIIYLDSEILDNDDSAPYGELVLGDLKQVDDNITSKKSDAPINVVTSVSSDENNVEEREEVAEIKADTPIVAAEIEEKSEIENAVKPPKATAAKTTKTAKTTAEKDAPVKDKKITTTSKTAADKAEGKREKILVEGEGEKFGKFVIKKTDKGNYVFKLYSSNYRVVAIGSQPYADLKSCRGGINSVINNAEIAPIENQTLKEYDVEKCPKWELYLDKKDEARLRLIASNGNIVATTNDGYADVSGAKKGIAAIARACKGCAIVRNDDLW